MSTDHIDKIRYRPVQPKGQTNRSKWYDTAQWKKLRAMQLRLHPLCKMCKDNDINTVANVVDHIKPVNQSNIWDTQAGRYGSATDMDNLQSLCRTCHDKKTWDDRKKGY